MAKSKKDAGQLDPQNVPSAEAAKLIGRTPRQLANLANAKDLPKGVVKRAKGPKGRPALRWNVPKLVAWLIEREVAKAAPPAEPEASDSSGAQERIRELRAQRLEFDLEREMGQWCKLDRVRVKLDTLRDALRALSDELGRSFGAEAQELADDYVTEAFRKAREADIDAE